MNSRTIAAIATPPGMGAVSLIRVSGDGAKEIVASVFSGRSDERWEPRYQHFGRILNQCGDVIDEVLLTWFPGPKSFTGEDVVEVACHGGVLVTKNVLAAILEAGAEAADPGEFSQRAFFNGRIDLTQAEAIMDLISAQTDLAVKAANQQLQGRLGALLEDLRQSLISLIAHIEAYIDFPDEDIDPDSTASLLQRCDSISDQIAKLLSTADQGRILREGIRTVICGAPNAGKSSLLNVLLGFDRAIVTATAGTTRDTIEEVINLRGIPVRLVDTAGIRNSEEAIEREGIERSRSQIAEAELILFVVDSSESRAAVEEIEFPEGARIIRLLNKSDLPRHADWEDSSDYSFSCFDPEVDEELRNYLYSALSGEHSFETADLVAINARHQHCLIKAGEGVAAARGNLEMGESAEFVAMDLRQALGAVGDVIGKTDVEEILGEIFSSFCIGK